MALDIASVCSDACNASSAQGFFVGMAVVFAVYIGLDVMVSSLTIGARLQDNAAHGK
tara:strand:+ start:558 stop:728 length:171 start_codon:yes stop_codon:yes gene_type:complete